MAPAHQAAAGCPSDMDRTSMEGDLLDSARTRHRRPRVTSQRLGSGHLLEPRTGCWTRHIHHAAVLPPASREHCYLGGALAEQTSASYYPGRLRTHRVLDRGENAAALDRRCPDGAFVIRVC